MAHSKLLIIVYLLCLSAGLSGQGFEHFITTRGSKLMDGEEVFRFISWNVPNLNYVEDEMNFTTTNPYGLPDEFEIRDAMATVQQMGGRVIRLYTIPVRSKEFPEEAVTFVEAPGVFNEEAFKTLDTVLALANTYQIRLIFPLVNNWQWMGGVPNYADFRNKTWSEFWTDPQLIEDFKQTIDFVVNRTNTVTGVKYKDDKAILCWETGNELQGPHEWTVEITRYIKSLDDNHLIMDGYHAINELPIREGSIEEPSIDIITSHHYEEDPLLMSRNIAAKVAQVAGKKPYILGEIGFISTSGMAALLDEVIENADIAGALTWSIRYHHRNGGFYWHSEPVGHGIYKAYHWPGFSSGDAYDEKNFLKLWRQKAFEIQGRAVPPVPKPQPPMLFPIKGPHAINWQGSAGAAGYHVQRSASDMGPWQTVGYHISDAEIQNFALFHDTYAKLQQTYYYRVIAVNESGQSAPSNLVGPVRFETQAVVDNMSNIGTLYSSRDVEVETGEDRKFKEIMYRLSGNRGSEIIYHVPGNFQNVAIFAFEHKPKNQLQLYGSMDGDVFYPLMSNHSIYTQGERIYDYANPKHYHHQGNENWEYIKVSFLGKAYIGRVEIEYSTPKVEP
jgi:hypothetical protein